jgi:hypothetical protein
MYFYEGQIYAQVVFVIYEFKKCYLILMHSTNLDQFQIITLALIQTACWLTDRGREEGELNTVWVTEEECTGRMKNLTQPCNLFCTSTTGPL